MATFRRWVVDSIIMFVSYTGFTLPDRPAGTHCLVFKACRAPGEKLLCVWKVPLFLIGLIVLSFSIALLLSA